MSKRVSASATALPNDGPDLDHAAKPLKYLTSNLRNVCATPFSGVAQSESSNARAENDLASKGTKSVPLISPTQSVALTRASMGRCFDQVPENGTRTDEAPQRVASGNQMPSPAALEAKDLTKSESPVLVKGQAAEVAISISGPSSIVKRVTPRHAASEAKRQENPALRADTSTKSASPKRAKAHLPQSLADFHAPNENPKQRKTLIRTNGGGLRKPTSIPPDLPDVYAMRTDGDCMVPEILDGQKIIVSKSEEIRRGDTVCLWLKNPSQPKGYSALVKKVAMLPPPHVTFPYTEHPESEIVALVFVEQINPPRAYQFRCDQVLAMHKVIDVQADDGTSVMKAPEPAAPKAAVEQRPTPYGILEAYKTWLGLELRYLCGEMADDPAIIASNYPSLMNEPDLKKRADLIERIFSFVGKSGSWHFGRDDKASSRAEFVLNAVGCDWREEG